MKWRITIEGEPDVLEFLAQIHSAEWAIRSANGEYYLAWSILDEIEDAADARGAALELAFILSGVAALRFGSRSALRLGRSELLDPNGRSHQYVFPEPATIEIGIGAKPLTPEFIVAAVQLALDDPLVLRALQLYGQGDRTWTNLYRVVELMEASGAVLERWTTRARMRQFRHTANHPAASGLEARHGHLKKQPPPKPMTRREARLLVESLLHRWIEDRSRRP